MKLKIFIISTLLIGINSCTVTNAIPVKTGIEVLRDNNFDILAGKRVGLITNPTGVDSRLKSTIDILYDAKNVKLVALFGPEHGVRGDVHAGDTVNNTVDPATGVTVYSIFGKTRKPTPEMLKDIDVLVYDIQDIGCRSYTFISTMGLAMEAAAENNIDFVVLDRPNPLGGLKIEGNYVEEGYYSFVSQFKIPYIYAQTCGELAIMLNEENMLAKKCKLQVVKMEGWKRSMTFEDTGLEWVLASPHIPHKHSALFYPITGILGELGYVSIGVGYTLPFQIIGAPWIEADKLANAMNDLNLAGLHFRPIYFKPFYSTFKGENCQGVEIHITDYDKVKLAEVQFYIMQVLNDLYPGKAVFNNANTNRYNMFDKVSGSNVIRTTFTKRHRFEDIATYWYKDVEDYKKLSSKYYLYK
ncbi:MAG: DUF1343 domain-containing protein [Paludibacteraceae bacterium]|jgi:uncharacterized protein YbbC (DUF1343 family)|nr:DUF1343 domain-containing protein [Paludibacteraceae bacterium]